MSATSRMGILERKLTAKVVDHIVSGPCWALGEHSNGFKQILDPVWAHDT